MKYVRPESYEAASALLAEETGIARILSGGTDVLVQMRSEVVEPSLIVDLKHLDGMREIVAEDGGFRIGAAVSGAQLAEHEALCAAWPGVVEAAGLIGSSQIQSRASLAGNLCNGSPAADSVPAMVAAGAVARVFGAEGFRDVPVAEIPAGPGKTNLKKGEFLISIYLPVRPERAGDAYLRFIPRTEMDIAVCSAGINLVTGEEGTCTEVRVALGAVAPTVILVEEAASALIGSKLDDEALKGLAAAVEAACRPIGDKRGTVEFRIKTAGVLARRAAEIAYQRSGAKR